MSIPMIQINWLDGRITRIPEICVGDAFGQNIQPELEIKFDDISDGIWLLLRHNEPVQPQKGVHKESDPRGLESIVLADAFYQIATAEDIPNIAILYYEGEPVLANDKGEIINLAKINAIKNIYMDNCGDSICNQVACLYKILAERGEGDEDKIAEKLGITPAFLEYARRQALMESDEEAGFEAQPASVASETAPASSQNKPQFASDDDDMAQALADAFGFGSDDEDSPF